MLFGRREEDFTQMEQPIKGVSTELARMLAMTPEDLRSYMSSNPGAFSPTERRSGRIAENKIRAMNRKDRVDVIRNQERV